MTRKSSAARSGPALIRAAEYIRTSTNQQRYSVENQTETIREYAARHQMEVVRTYMDYGKSGLHLHGRAGLTALLEDVKSGNAEYSVVLVYDVSRWGRFQNIDESAAYDFLCRRAGVRVTYCAEAFEGYESTVGSVVKDLRRVMAGEYSRALSIRIWQGQCTSARKGFVATGMSGIIGYRRYLVDPFGRPKFILAPGERKSIRSDKIILVPGPREEVELVWRIFDLFTHTNLSTGDIARLLNQEGVAKPSGKPWTCLYIRAILISPVYLGHNIYNRTSVKLGGKSVQNPPDQWIRRDGVFRPLVTQEQFEAAQRKIWSRSTRKVPTDTLTRKLRELLQMKGYLSEGLIDKTPGMPALGTYVKRFGNIANAFAEVGYCSIQLRGRGDHLTALAYVRSRLVSEIEADLASIGIPFSSTQDKRLLTIDRRWTVYVRVAGCFFYAKQNKHLWTIHVPKTLNCNWVLTAAMDRLNIDVFRVFLTPRSAFPLTSPASVDSARLARYRLAGVCDVVSAVMRDV